MSVTLRETDEKRCATCRWYAEGLCLALSQIAGRAGHDLDGKPGSRACALDWYGGSAAYLSVQPNFYCIEWEAAPCP